MTLTSDKNLPGFQYFTADNIHSSKVSAIFTTRNGGVSGMNPETEHLRSLNLQFNAEGDTHSNVSENYRIVAASQRFCVEGIINVWQKHTDKVIVIDKDSAKNRTGFEAGEADALITNLKGVLLSVRTADCVPVLLYDRTNGAVGAVHAGWRGAFSKIVSKTIQHMRELYRTNPADVRAAIGAAIGACCYEVDMDFYRQFHKEYGSAIDAFFQIEPGKKPYCNLKAMNKAFLIEAGVPAQNIEVSEWCTMCHPELFYSHRRNGEKRGAMAAFIGMKPE